jgi:hypothetical protein
MDVKSMNVIRDELQWMVIEKLDQNHVLKIWGSVFNQSKFIESKLSDESAKAWNVSTAETRLSATMKPKRYRCVAQLTCGEGLK